MNFLTDIPLIKEEAETIPSEVRELERELLIVTIL